MARSIKIASTKSADLAPIGGQIERDFERITDFVSQRLGMDCASIFTEPVSNKDGSRIDWYANQGGRAEPFDMLDEERSARLLEALSLIEGQIEACAQDLIASSVSADRAFGRALLNAISIPNQSHIYALGDKPVLVAWGYRLANRKAYRGGLKKRAPIKKAAVAMEAPQTVAPVPPDVASVVKEPKSRHSWAKCMTAFLWMLLALLIGVILYFLFQACAFSFLPWFNQCAGSNAGKLMRLTNLQQEIRVLENAVAFKNENCLPLVDTGPALSDNEITQRLDDRSAGNGALQVSLAWNGSADLDLAIKCTSGVLWFRNRQACGASLDTDSNGGANITLTPVENIVWQGASDIPAGDLPIFVTLYSHKLQPAQDVPYTIRVVRRQGAEITSQYSINGKAGRDQIKQVVRIGSASEKRGQ
ncbi:hypothetical protein [Cohaesibacter celericrescens]|uniref:hypothetical protein n=1 Tax=Cohaesibacter celericrescens TaxID=2067669 RepID=UPI0035686A5A